MPGPAERPEQYVTRLAMEKARASSARVAVPLPVLGADTEVALDGVVFGKPRDRDDGVRMLLALADRTHEVSDDPLCSFCDLRRAMAVPARTYLRNVLIQVRGWRSLTPGDTQHRRTMHRARARLRRHERSPRTLYCIRWEVRLCCAARIASTIAAP